MINNYLIDIKVVRDIVNEAISFFFFAFTKAITQNSPGVERRRKK